MKVKCIKLLASELPERYIGTYLYEGNSYEDDLVRGREYLVYSVYVSNDGCVLYLMIPDAGELPEVYPAVLFEVVDMSVPRSWLCTFNDKGQSLGADAFFGYKEIVEKDSSHLLDLVEGCTDAWLIFDKRRQGIDAEYGVNEV